MKTWFITGASRGFGRVWTEALLERGDKVAATSRSLASIADLKGKYGDRVLTLELDVTKPDQAKAAVNQAHAQFGKLEGLAEHPLSEHHPRRIVRIRHQREP